MCNVRNWTLRKQITVLFVVSTVLFLILLAAVVTVNLIIMHNETRQSVRERLAENTSSNMGFIVQESGSAVTQEISLLSNVNSQINSLLTIASNQVANLMETAVFTTARDPTLTYSGLQTASGITFQQSTRYNALVSFDASAVYYPNPSILTQTFTGQADFNNFIKSSGSLDKYLPSMLQNERAQDIMYVNIYYVQGTAEVLRVYPAYPIPSSYSPKTSNWYTATQAMGTNSGIAWKKAIGPYIDQKGSGQKLFAISLPLVQNGALIGAIAIEFLTSPIDELVNSITFLSTGQALLINSDYNIFSAPQNWQLSPSTIFSVNSATVRSLVGNISSFITSSVTAISDETGTTTIATVERIPNPSNTTTVSYYVAKAFFDSTQMVDSGWLYGLILYTEVSDADQVNSDLTSLMNSDLLTIGIITLVAIVLMLLIVFIVSFRISTRISTPLMKLKEFSDLVHKNAAHKTRSDEYFKEYENDEGIIGELIHTYKKVIGISAEPIKSRYSKNQTSRKEEIEYPLNQFHADFITKTQGESPINWKGLIDQIPNEKKTN